MTQVTDLGPLTVDEIRKAIDDRNSLTYLSDRECRNVLRFLAAYAKPDDPIALAVRRALAYAVGDQLHIKAATR